VVAFLVVTKQDAIDMRDALNSLNDDEDRQVQVDYRAKIIIQNTWFDTVKPPIPTTRNQALDAYRQIQTLIRNETDRFRKQFLGRKLIEANEKYKEVKRLSP